MTDNALYFPYIRVPHSEWFTRVLLYWDKVGSIVPFGSRPHPEEDARVHALLGEHMVELIRAGLVTVVRPGEHLDAVPNFQEAFLELIHRNRTIIERGPVGIGRLETSRIHMEKFGWPATTVVDELHRMGLARQAEGSWYDVERFTADLFMAYLTSVLGECLKMDPITDHSESLSVFSEFPQRNLSSPFLLDQLRTVVLDSALPAPAGVIDIRALTDFKREHRGQLVRFRRHIESSLVQIASISDGSLRNKQVHLLQDELRDETEQIRERMKERNWGPVVVGALCAVLPIAGAVAERDYPSAALGLPGLAYAVYSAFKGRHDLQREILRSPLAYAALAGEARTTP
jgi:hypothetical protein